MRNRGKITKLEYTKTFLNTVDINESELDNYMLMLWANRRRHSGGFRLTGIGNKFLKDTIKLECNTIKVINEIPVQAWYRIVLDLDKLIACPYYLNFDMLRGSEVPVQLSISFFDSKDALLMGLCGRDVYKYIEIRKRDYDD